MVKPIASIGNLLEGGIMWADLLDISVAVIGGGAGALLGYGMLLVIEQLFAPKAAPGSSVEECGARDIGARGAREA